jgi:hypothetical protein
MMRQQQAAGIPAGQPSSDRIRSFSLLVVLAHASLGALGQCTTVMRDAMAVLAFHGVMLVKHRSTG